MKLITFTFVSLLLLASCGDDSTEDRATTPEVGECDETPKTNLVHGAVGGNYPGVGRLVILDGVDAETGSKKYKICSGAALSDRIFLTAYHCLPDSQNGQPPPAENISYVKEDLYSLAATSEERDTILKNSPQALNIVRGDAPQMSKDDEGNVSIPLDSVERDIAVVVFEQNTFSDFYPVSSRRPTAGETVELVGFGDIIIPASGTLKASEKRHGTNVIEPLTPPYSLPANTILVSGFAQETDATIGTSGITLGSKGDSGGPLILDGAVSGVLSIAGRYSELENNKFTEGLKGDALNFYASTASSLAKNLFQIVKDFGSEIQTKNLGPDCD